MPKIVDTGEVIADLGAAIHAALKPHSIEPSQVKVVIGPEEIRILVVLEDEE